jgi:hypothetical protein
LETPEKTADHGIELIEIDRLHQIGVGALVQAANAILTLSQRRGHDDAAAAVLTQPRRQGVAVFLTLAEQDVDQRDIYRTLCQDPA